MFKKVTFLSSTFALLFILAGSAFAGTITLPRTGQTVCYDTSGALIACAGTGQDGDIKAGATWPNPRYTNNADNTVTDNLTGLTWIKDTTAPTVGSCVGGTGTWQQALDYVACLNSSSNGAGYLGHNDWRLPNINELESLFPITPSPYLNMYAYWSSTTAANSTDRAWSMSGGSILSDYVKSSFTNGNIKPVRGESGPTATSPAWKTGQTTQYATGDDGDLERGTAWPSTRFTDNNNETITDNLTGLVWTKDANAPGAPQCTPGDNRTWQQALDYVKCLNTNNFRGHNDWRLPNRKELFSLIDRHTHDPALPAGHPFINVQPKDYWTSTTHTDTTSAWNVNMADGYEAYDPKTGPWTGACYVWPVRAGQTGTSSGISAILTVAKSGAGTGTITSTPQGIDCGSTCSSAFSTGTSVTLSAVAGTSSAFAGWSGACTGTGTCILTMDASKNVIAAFTAVSQYALTVTKSGAGNGTVSATGLSCTGNTCTGTYSQGASVTLTAATDASSTFAGWGGVCSGTETTCTLTMDASKNVIVAFTAQVVVITSLSLSTGWNFISFPKQPPDTAIEKVLKDISPNIRIVWGYDNVTKQWKKYKPSAAGNELTTIEPGKGYWIYMGSGGTINMADWSAPSSTDIRLNDGWNLIGYSGTDSGDVVSSLSACSDTWKIIWTWDNGQWSAKLSDNSVTLQVLPLKAMKQGKAYWIKNAAIPVALTGGTFASGNFKVTVAEGTMPTSINAISPQVKAESVVPNTLLVKEYETNVTAGAKAYTLGLAEKGFITTAEGVVMIEIPFNTSLISNPSMIDSLHVFLKILNHLDNSVVIVSGTIVGNKIIAELRGLPANMTVVVIYDPYMRSVVSSPDNQSSQSAVPGKTTLETSYTWPAQNWHVIYSAKDASTTTAIKQYLNKTSLSEEEMDNVVKSLIGNNAVTAAKMYQWEIYKSHAYRSPSLIVKKTAADCGGALLGKAPCYVVHFGGEKGGSAYTRPDVAVTDVNEENHYGRIYIKPDAINRTIDKDGMSIFGTIAHEMFHSIQLGYELFGLYNKGYREGTATCYGELFDRKLGNLLAKPGVRQIKSWPGQIEAETFMLNNYLMIAEYDSTLPYTNQDFFVYVARKYGDNDYSFLEGLFNQMYTAIKNETGKAGAPANAAAEPDPPWKVMIGAMDLFFTENFNKTLKEVYLDFVRQRAMEHNEESRFGRPNETIDGLATNLFENGFYIDKTIDPLNIKAEAIVKDVSINQLSAMAVKIRPTQAVPAGGTGATLTLTVTSNGGIIDDTVKGFVYYNTRTNPAALQGNNTFNNFGLSAADEIVILISNTSFEKPIDVTINLTGANSKQTTLTISPNSLSGSINQEYTFTANAEGAPEVYKIIWNFGDQTGDTTVNNGSTAKHIFTQTGTYTITATMFDQTNKQVASASATATISATPTKFDNWLKATYATFELWIPEVIYSDGDNPFGGVRFKGNSEYFDGGSQWDGGSPYQEKIGPTVNGNTFSFTGKYVGQTTTITATVNQDASILLSFKYEIKSNSVYDQGDIKSSEFTLTLEFQNVPAVSGRLGYDAPYKADVAPYVKNVVRTNKTTYINDTTYVRSITSTNFKGGGTLAIGFH